MNFCCCSQLAALPIVHPTGPPGRASEQSRDGVGSGQPGSRVDGAAYGMLCDVISRHSSSSSSRRRPSAGGVGPTPAGDGACVNQRNGTLVLGMHGGGRAAGCRAAGLTACLPACWWSVSLARFLELACALLAAVAAAAQYPFVSLLVALLACRSVSLSISLPCLSVSLSVPLSLDLLQSLILFAPQ